MQPRPRLAEVWLVLVVAIVGVGGFLAPTPNRQHQVVQPQLHDHAHTTGSRRCFVPVGPSSRRAIEGLPSQSWNARVPLLRMNGKEGDSQVHMEMFLPTGLLCRLLHPSCMMELLLLTNCHQVLRGERMTIIHAGTPPPRDCGSISRVKRLQEVSILLNFHYRAFSTTCANTASSSSLAGAPGAGLRGTAVP